MILAYRILTRPRGQLAWSKHFSHARQARSSSSSSSSQPMYIRSLINKTGYEDGCLGEINGRSSDLRQGFPGSSCYLLPEYTPDPSQALTNISFQKYWKDQPQLGAALIYRFGLEDIYMIQERDQNNKNKLTDAAFWRCTMFHGWNSLDGLNWPGRSNDVNHDRFYTYILWRTQEGY